MTGRGGAWTALALGVGAVLVVAGCEVRAAGGDEAAGADAAVATATASTGAESAATQERPRKEVLRPGGELFSRVVRAGDLLFLSGMLGTRAEEDGVGPETRVALESIQSELEAVGASMADVVKCTVFLADLEDYGAMNEVYGEFFPSDPPARSAVQAGLVFDARVEIECIAVAPEA